MTTYCYFIMIASSVLHQFRSLTVLEGKLLLYCGFRSSIYDQQKMSLALLNSDSYTTQKVRDILT